MHTYASNGEYFQATGSGSTLELSAALTTLTQQGSWNVYAQNGGDVDLSGLTSLTSTHGITFNDTNGSTLSLAGVTTLNGNNSAISITDTGGSSLVLNSNLTNLPGVDVSLDGSDAHVADNWTKLTNGELKVDTGSYTLPGLTDVDGSNLIAENSGTLALPGMHTYSSNGAYFQANGYGSVLDVSPLTTLTQQGGWTVNAYTGGTIKLSGLTSLNSTHGISINDSGGSTILDPNLTTLTGVTATLDGTDAHVADSWTSFTNGDLTVGTGSYSLPGLSDVDGSYLIVNEGGGLTLLGVQSYASNGAYFQANGSGCVLDLSALTTLTQTGSWTVYAQNGGEVDLSGLTSLTSTQGISITDTGSSTLLDPHLASLNGISVNTDGSDSQLLNDWTTFTNGTLQITGGALSLPNLTDLDTSNLPLSGGATLNLSAAAGVTLNGNVAFSGGAVTLEGAPNVNGATVTMSGGGILILPSRRHLHRHGNAGGHRQRQHLVPRRHQPGGIHQRRVHSVDRGALGRKREHVGTHLDQRRLCPLGQQRRRQRHQPLRLADLHFHRRRRNQQRRLHSVQHHPPHRARCLDQPRQRLLGHRQQLDPRNAPDRGPGRRSSTPARRRRLPSASSTKAFRSTSGHTGGQRHAGDLRK